jgi:hypothetical protein
MRAGNRAEVAPQLRSSKQFFGRNHDSALTCCASRGDHRSRDIDSTAFDIGKSLGTNLGPHSV